ncbi:MAG TPA: hypothetical protein VMT24_03580 [Aggregatilineaceae bacterium]|jgi:hypothetical protein|nr:hypothetical protein [Aggregatilineaceae bacterium]
MTTTRRNLMWPLIIMAVGAVWLLMTAGALPEAAGDIVLRAWPAVLVLFGFDVLFGRRRVQIWRLSVEMSLVGLAVTIVLLAGLVWLAYRNQAEVVRADNVQVFSQVLPEEVSHLRLEISLDRTAVTASPATSNPRELGAEFKGSKDSDVAMTWSVEGETGILTVTETHASPIPKLKDYGRGTLNLTLPVEAIVDVLDLSNHHGDMTADLQPLRVEQLAVSVDNGDLTVHLPAQDVLQGKLKTGGGLELFVPQNMALVLKAQGSGEPEYRYDTFRYDLLRDGTLKLRNTEAFQISLDVWLTSGAPLTVTDLQ